MDKNDGNDNKALNKTAMAIRYATAAPIVGLVTLVLIYAIRPELFGSVAAFVLSLIFITVLPLLAYPLQRFIPGVRDEGREGQRSLAMYFAVGGYVLGCISCIFVSAPTGLWLIYLEYLLSGLLIFVFNKCFHLKASGHACGIAGPVAFLVYAGIPALIPGIVILLLICWASIYTKRHTIWQFIGGCAIPVAVLLVLMLIFGRV